MMADYTLTRLTATGDADEYEVRLPDGTVNKFVYSNAEKVVGNDADFQHWVDVSVRRAKRSSEYLKRVV